MVARKIHIVYKLLVLSLFLGFSSSSYADAANPNRDLNERIYAQLLQSPPWDASLKANLAQISLVDSGSEKLQIATMINDLSSKANVHPASRQLLNLYLNNFRSTAPTSPWFRDTRLPQLIDELNRAPLERDLPPEFHCEPGTISPEILKILEALFINENAREVMRNVYHYDPLDERFHNKMIERGSPEGIPSEVNAGNLSEENPARKTRITLHHTAADTTPEAVYFGHLKGRGWGDIGYNFILSQQAIYEARLLKWRAAHAGDREKNSGNIGISLIGNFNERQPTRDEIAATTWMVCSLTDPNSPLCQEYTRAGIHLEITEVKGHRHHKATECPGDNLMACVHALDMAVKFREEMRLFWELKMEEARREGADG
jgi:hypothetical protein